MSRPTLLPSRLARRGARGAAGLAALVVTVPVGSRIAFGITSPTFLCLANFRSRLSVAVDYHAADVLTIHKILVALINFVQGVLPGDEFGELDAALMPEAEDHRNVVQGVGAAEQRALDPPVVADQDAAWQHHLVVPDPGHHDRARLA